MPRTQGLYIPGGPGRESQINPQTRPERPPSPRQAQDARCGRHWPALGWKLKLGWRGRLPLVHHCTGQPEKAAAEGDPRGSGLAPGWSWGSYIISTGIVTAKSMSRTLWNWKGFACFFLSRSGKALHLPGSSSRGRERTWCDTRPPPCARGPPRSPCGTHTDFCGYRHVSSLLDMPRHPVLTENILT